MADKQEKNSKDMSKASMIIKKCGCTPAQFPAWEYQDKKYGIGMRAFNPSNKGYVCTVCQRVSQ